jgi:hypothetical protein
MAEHYYCYKCKKKIHRSRVANLTGTVICCGERMAGPDDVLHGSLALAGLGLVAGGAWLLHAKAGWGLVLAIVTSTIVSPLLLLVFCGVLECWGRRGK